MHKDYFLAAARIFHRSAMVLQRSLLLQFLIGGVCFALLFPPFRTPDEEPHFFSGLTNASKIQGRTETYCGKSVSLTHQFAGANDRIGSRSFEVTNLPETCTDAWTYGWLLNYPSVFIAKLVTADGKYSSARSLLLFYLARIINGILVIAVLGRAYLLVSEFGLRSGVLLLFSFTLSALFMQQSWSVTADVPVNLLALYLSLVLLYFPYLKSVDLFIFFTLGVVACSSKPVIAPLVPTFLLVAFLINAPVITSLKQFFHSLLRNRFLIIGTASSCLGIATGLFQIGAEKDRGNKYIAGQMDFIKEHPWDVFKALNGKLAEFASQAEHFFNTPLGYFKLQIPSFMKDSFERIALLFLILECILFAISLRPLLAARAASPTQYRNKLYVALATALASSTLYFCSLLPIFMMYLVWTPVGALEVQGVQARYFYPMIFCLISLFGAVVSWVTRQDSLSSQLTTCGTKTKTQNLIGEWAIVGALVLVGLCYWMSLFHSIVLTYFAP